MEEKDVVVVDERAARVKKRAEEPNILITEYLKTYDFDKEN